MSSMATVRDEGLAAFLDWQAMSVRPKGRIGVGSTVRFCDDGLWEQGAVIHFGFTHCWVVTAEGNRFWMPRTDLTLVRS